MEMRQWVFLNELDGRLGARKETRLARPGYRPC